MRCRTGALSDPQRDTYRRIGNERHVFCFFFSSRRRHTRFDCDWSSDVCSSDLLRTERLSVEQHAQAKQAELEQRYHQLLQEHMSYGITIAKLEAQVAEYLAFLERDRKSVV